MSEPAANFGDITAAAETDAEGFGQVLASTSARGPARHAGRAEEDGRRSGADRNPESEISDLLWVRIQGEARKLLRSDPTLGGFISTAVLVHSGLEAAIAHRLASRLAGGLGLETLGQLLHRTMIEDPALGRAVRLDVLAAIDRDPAIETMLEPILYFKGLHALQAHRIAHALWMRGRRDMALHLRSRVSEVLQVDIHPAVPIGAGLFLDHGTGISIGETAEIGENVSILQGVTLGAEFGDRGPDRHPKISRGVMIGAGAKLFGNITVGRCSRIGAGSIVLEDVPPNVTVAGVPARVLGPAGCAEPSRTMNQMFYDVGL